MAADFFIGESLVGDGNEVAHIDLIIGSQQGAAQAVQMFGPAQAAVARAVVDSVAEGIIPRDKADDYCVMVGVFIHWDAKDDKKIYQYNYQATKESIQRALANKPSVADVLGQVKAARHPFASGAEESMGSAGAKQ